jgi:hypothetical protein
MPSEENRPENLPLVESLSRQFHAHDYPVSRKEAIRMRLPVVKERDTTLESLMWSLWLDIEEDLQERRPFDPVYEILNSSQKDTLLRDIRQLNLPANAPGPTYFQAELDPLIQASTTIEPIDACVVDAIIESARLAFRAETRAKILASRLPDLRLQYNVLVEFTGWEKKHPQ